MELISLNIYFLLYASFIIIFSFQLKLNANLILFFIKLEEIVKDEFMNSLKMVDVQYLNVSFVLEEI